MRPEPATKAQLKTARMLNEMLRLAATEEDYSLVRADIRKAYKAGLLTNRQINFLRDRYVWSAHTKNVPVERL